MEITSHTTPVGLLGRPVAHSKSPQIMNAAFRERNLPFVYLAFDVGEEELADAVAGMGALGFRGFNVTIPHKVAVMDYLDEVEEAAEAIGAVNTVIRDGSRWVGTNTDGAGYIRSLMQESGFDPKGESVTLIGAGGAARAVGYALARAGANRVTVVNRTTSKAEELAARLSRWTRAEGAPPERLEEALKRSSLVVQTTSVGMHPQINGSVIPEKWLRPGLLVSDLVYHPRETRLLRDAREAGAKTHEGLGMLVHQAALAFERWTGTEAPADRMRNRLEASLDTDSAVGHSNGQKEGAT
ncbi:shikimate dehydrogenase [Desmospora profundinema]|uniref:Shikimate dehydrogenase (NADP(+)) n=1 Tax=Desmospora profundinema TaxID=1571184 RepID=A0ABU1IK22_9BACL|nr:shikimate dehydrogenase [Desmospora profundinema]MDR6225116.1 shikimate dehydrogenase [Desmospora profundinema]